MGNTAPCPGVGSGRGQEEGKGGAVGCGWVEWGWGGGVPALFQQVGGWFLGEVYAGEIKKKKKANCRLCQGQGRSPSPREESISADRLTRLK